MRLRWFGCLCSTLVLVACVGPSNKPGPPANLSEAWTQLGGAGSHTAWGAGGPTPPLHELWYTSLPGGLEFPPIVVDGRIVVASGRAFGLDSTGATNWSYQPERGALAYGPVALQNTVVVPAVAGNTVFVAGVDARSGKPLWRASFPFSSGQYPWVWAAADDDTIVVLASGASRRLVAYDARGRLLWSTTTTAGIPLGMEGQMPLAVGAGSAVVKTTGGLEAHDLATGQLIWSGRRSNPNTNDPPFIIGSTVLAGVGQHPFRLVGYSLGTGRRTVSRSLPGWLDTVQVYGTTIYASGDSFTACHWPDLRVLWHVRTSEPAPFLPLAGGVLVVQAAQDGSDSAFGFYGPNPAAPWVWTIPHSAPNPLSDTGGEISGLVPTGGGVLMSTIDGTLFAFGPST